MKAKEYKGIEDYIKRKNEKKNQLIKGTIMMKAKRLNMKLIKI